MIVYVKWSSPLRDSITSTKLACRQFLCGEEKTAAPIGFLRFIDSIDHPAIKDVFPLERSGACFFFRDSRS